MTNLFLGFLNRSLSAAVLIFAVVLVRLAFKKAPKWLLCALWALAAVRLLCPFSIESVLSLIPSAEPVQPEIVYSAAPAITSGIPAVDAIVNPPLQAAFTPDPAQSANPLQILTWLAAWVWLGGCAVLVLYAAISALRLRLRVRTAVRLEGNVFQSEFVPSPFILGVIRPRIYLPFGLEPGAQDMVLAHERAHLKRGDQLWKPLGFLLLTAYWFNPVCWLAYVLFCRDIEAACDEKVVRELGESCKTTYSRALLQCSVPRRMITACPLAFGETGVKGRIKSVLNYKKPAFWVVLAAVFVSIAVAVCFLTDPKTDAEQPEEEPPASSTADSPAEADSTPPTSAFFSSIEDYAEYYIAQVILPEPIEYKVLTDGGFETVTDTVQDAQMVNLEQLASLSGLDPEGDLQLWSYKIAIAPKNADGRTFMLGTDTGLSYIDGQEYLVDNTRYLVTVTYRSETQDYRLLGWTKDTDGTALAVYEQSGRLTDYLRDIYAATHGANNIQGYFYPSFYNGMDGYGRAVHIDAYLRTFTDKAGGWSAYLPTTGWEYDEQDDLWRSTYSTGSTFAVRYVEKTITECSAGYTARGCLSEVTQRGETISVEAGEQNEMVYLCGVKDGCYEVTIHWPRGADETDASGYNPYLQARYEGQLLKQMAASFTACAGASVTLGSADGYTFRLETETASCPEGRTDCTLAHTKTQLVCEENGQVHPLGAPLLDGAWWLIDINAPKARFGYLEQDLHTGRFSSGSDRFDLTRWRSDDRVEMYTDASLSGDPIALPDAAETDRSLPVQRCELVLPNGVFPGMDYAAVLQRAAAYQGSPVRKGKMRGDNFTVDGVSYQFTQHSDGTVRLDAWSCEDELLYGGPGIGSSPDFLRGIQLGDNLDHVLAALPAADWTPEQERKQFLYGSSGDALCAWIWWDHNGFYKIDIGCGELSCIIRTGTDGLVRSISVSG